MCTPPHKPCKQPVDGYAVGRAQRRRPRVRSSPCAPCLDSERPVGSRSAGRDHTHIVKPDSAETFHDQVGYWLWEPAPGTVFYTVSIPRAQVAMAVGHAASSAKTFKLDAVRGSETNGIVSNPFLEHAFKTLRVTVEVTIHPGGMWSYDQDTVMAIPGAADPFHHTNRNTLRKIGEPTPNSLATPRRNPAAQPGSLGVGSLRTMMPRRDEPAADARGARGSSKAE